MPEKEKTPDVANVSIPKELFNKIEQLSKGKGFDSVSSYVTYVLKQVVLRLESEKGSQKKKNDVLSKKEEEEVKKRLKIMGYL